MEIERGRWHMTKYEIDSELTKLAKQKAPSCVSEYSSVYCSFPWRRIFTESVKSTLSGGKMVCRNGKMQGIAFAERLRAEGIPTELHEVKGACHGYETALGNKIVKESIQRRIRWIQARFNEQ